MDWGTFSLVAALKNLLRTALADRLNQKFLLLSESGIPIYPPEVGRLIRPTPSTSRAGVLASGAGERLLCPAHTSQPRPRHPCHVSCIRSMSVSSLDRSSCVACKNERMAGGQVLWLELLVEEKSRVNACELWDGVRAAL